MKQLNAKFTKWGRQFEQLCRTGNTAIYRQHINGRQKSYEVIVIRVADRKPSKINGRVNWVECGPYECYPASEKWGMCGWTYSTEEDARAKYELINDLSYKLPAPPLYPIRARAADGIAQDCVCSPASINTAVAADRRSQAECLEVA
jgi:hypothetical protein